VVGGRPGYGMRAWRSLAWLAGVTVIFALAFHLIGFTRPPQPASYWTSLLYAFRSTISLTENEVKLTAGGQLLQALLRLIGPVLLGGLASPPPGVRRQRASGLALAPERTQRSAVFRVLSRRRRAAICARWPIIEEFGVDIPGRVCVSRALHWHGAGGDEGSWRGGSVVRCQLDRWMRSLLTCAGYLGRSWFDHQALEEGAI
jgi:hypothetical protein